MPPPTISVPASNVSTDPADRVRIRRFVITCVALLLAFSVPLFHLVSFALGSDLYSFIVIVPFISGYLVWIERDRLSPSGPALPAGWTVSLAAVGLALLAWAVFVHLGGGKTARVDSLALSMYSLVCLLGASACLYLGRDSLRVVGFPLAFLVFLAPFPAAIEVGIETVLQHGSSWFAHQFLDLAGMPTYRDGTFFQLPGFSMQVAPECSGIRSTLALFLTSLVAGQMFLRSPWSRATLALVVLPIALIRNGFRVFVIGELCVQIGPHMIHSWVHRQGGPLFFALSLIPFSLILYYLFRRDRHAVRQKPNPN